MARKIKSQGWYTFQDGYRAWYHGMNSNERKMEIKKHGLIINFVPTDN